MWNTPSSFELARKVSAIPGLYCGPAAIGWIAAVWNQNQHRPYNLQRLSDKNFFADGPRPFHHTLPGFQQSLNDILRRETNNELALADELYFGVRTVHKIIDEYSMPVIVRVLAPKIRHGLHYVTMFNSEDDKSGKIHFSLHDNGVYHNYDGRELEVKSGQWKRSSSGVFLLGAKRVTLVQQNHRHAAK